MDAEVGIIGVGTMGSMALWQLARKGISVIGFEQFGIGHDRSAAGGETRIFRTVYKEGASYVPMLQRAYNLWRELEYESGSQLLTLTDGLVIGDPDLPSMNNALQSIERYDLDHEILSFTKANKRYPQHRLASNEIIVVDRMAGYLRPQYAIVLAVERAKELGAIVQTHSHVEKIESYSDGIRILANGTEYKVGKLLVTAGPWINEVIHQFDKQIEIRRLINTWFFAKNMESYTEKNFPVFTRESCGLSYYGVPSVDGNMVKIGLASRPEDAINAPDQLDRNIEAKDLSLITQTVQDHLPGLFHDPGRVSVYMESYTTDNHPIVGRLPNHKNIFVLGGFSGHGFKLAPIIGHIGASLLLGEKNPFPIESLSPNRFSDVKTG